MFYINGPAIKELMLDFCFYTESNYHFDKNTGACDQGLLRALVAKHHFKGLINYHMLDTAANWNPTGGRGYKLELVGDTWINKDNGQVQKIYHAAGVEKLWTKKHPSPSVNKAWQWVGGQYQ